MRLGLETPTDIEGRHRLWEALSDLYLDNEPTERDFEWIAEVCASSPYSLEEIDCIMFAEVYPALIGNLLSPAGEWAGFNAEWLNNKILTGCRPRIYAPWWLSPVKQFFFGAKWRRIKKRINEKRHAN
jgi:hypothetical protein